MSPAIQARLAVTPSRSSLAEERPVGIPHGADFLTGSLSSPRSPRGVVLIANDRGCSRHVPALCALARELRAAGFATLMVDLLTIADHESPAVAARLRMQTELLAGRIASARVWFSRSRLQGLPLVLLGMGSAAPAALLAAASRPAGQVAVVACGPLHDAAGPALAMVTAPVLLIAHRGPFDEVATQVRALGRLRGHRDMAVLCEAVDPIKDALDVARAAVAFLGFVGSQQKAA